MSRCASRRDLLFSLPQSLTHVLNDPLNLVYRIHTDTAVQLTHGTSFLKAET
jgi:hypothetical protein